MTTTIKMPQPQAFCLWTGPFRSGSGHCCAVITQLETLPGHFLAYGVTASNEVIFRVWGSYLHEFPTFRRRMSEESIEVVEAAAFVGTTGLSDGPSVQMDLPGDPSTRPPGVMAVEIGKEFLKVNILSKVA
jgi:hypothetical protein